MIRPISAPMLRVLREAAAGTLSDRYENAEGRAVGRQVLALRRAGLLSWMKHGPDAVTAAGRAVLEANP